MKTRPGGSSWRDRDARTAQGLGTNISESSAYALEARGTRPLGSALLNRTKCSTPASAARRRASRIAAGAMSSCSSQG